VIRLVRAATNASTSSGEYTELYASGSGTGCPFISPPAVGDSSRSNDQTASRPMRSAVSATVPIVSALAVEPVVGSVMPTFTFRDTSPQTPVGKRGIPR
jgi:hypothetical protein